MSCSEMTIGNFKISKNNKPFVIAEISGNHNGNLERAFELIKLAKDAGADAVKIQTYTADTMTLDCDREEFLLKDGLWKGKTLYELYKWAHTPWDWHAKLFEKAAELGILLFSSPFDETAVDLLMSLDTPAFKIASFEMTDHPLVEYVAQTKKPMIISTGMASLEEIKECQAVIEKYHQNYVFLHCVSGYPTPAEDYNLMTIPKLQKDLGCMVGLSDHTLGVTTSVASVSLGARVIEKHFTFSRDEEGPDNAFSLEPHEFKRLCDDVKTAYNCLGTGSYKLKDSESANHKFRRSLYVSKDIKQGEEISPLNIKRIRPGLGIPAKDYSKALGKIASKNIPFGTPLSWEDLN